MQRATEKIEQDLLRPIFHTSVKSWIALGVSGCLVLAGVAAFGYQLYAGIGVWGINSPVFWAFDITNFVFWIGISHAGTLISAILRLCNATWRRPVTRCAEAITVFAIFNRRHHSALPYWASVAGILDDPLSQSTLSLA